MPGAVAQAQDAEASPPGAPTNLRVTDTSQDGHDTLTWDAPSSNGGADITNYHVQRRSWTSEQWDAPGNTASLSNPTNTANVKYFKNAFAGYTYRARAVNSVGHGPWSNEISVGGKPQWKSGSGGTPTATPHASLPQITLDWTGKLQHSAGKPVTKWVVRYKKASSGDFEVLREVEAGTTNTIVDDLEYNTAYDFDVIAYNEDRRSYTSADARATTVSPPGTPGAPTNLRVTDTTNDLSDALAWDAPARIGDSAITGYQLRRRASNSDSWETPANTSSTATTYTSNKAVDPEHGYSYRVRAVNSDGHGPWSNEIRVGGKPAWKSGEAGTPWAAPHATALEIRVGWNGRLSHDGGSPITRFTLRIKEASEDNFRTYWSSTTNGSNFPVVEVAYQLAWNTSYDFNVIVENAHRKSTSANVRATTPPHPDAPGAPTDLKVTDVSNVNRDSLAWTAPTDTGASAITGYQLERRETTSDEWEDPIDTGSAATSYASSKPGWAVGYFYRVRAVNSDAPGGWSNQITVGGRPTWKSDAEGTPTATPHANRPEVTLDWAGKLNHDGGSAVTKWRWRYQKAGSNDWVWKDELPAGQTSVTATDLEYGTAYDFDVIAYNADRSSFTSPDARATTSLHPGPPAAPTNLMATATDTSHDTQDKLEWTAPPSNGADVTTYQVQRRRSHRDNWETPVNTDATDTAYTFDRGGWGDGYVYRVRAVNSGGPGAWSNEITVGGPPQWKEGAEGTPTATPHATLPQITLNWAGKLNHGAGKAVTTWTVRYKKAGSDDFEEVGDFGRFTTSTIVTDLEYDTAYDFDVVASNGDRRSASAAARATTVSGDRGSLVAFYNATGGANWTHNNNWLSGEPLGRWVGVVTDDDGRVIALELNDNNLQGSLPAEISNLSELLQIYVLENEGLSGSLPLSMAGMSSMKRLDASGTGLCASYDSALREWLDGLAKANVPDCPDDRDRAVLMEFYRATGGENWTHSTNWGSDKPLDEWSGVQTDILGRVTVLDLEGVNLTGSIPESFGNLTELRRLYLDENGLTGPLPAGFGKLSKLQYASLVDNKLTGPLPAELGNLANLEKLYLRNNLLTGRLPNTLDGMKKLRLLYLNNQEGLYQEGKDGDSGLTGPIPASVGSMPSLEELVLDRNKLTGPIPTELANSTSLRRIAANRNRITGSIPAELGNMRQLQVLGLANNDLSGTLPTELGNLKQLERLSLHDNEELSGPVPASIGELSKLYRLAISNTGMSGTLPSSLTNLSALSEFFSNGTTLCAPTDDAFQQWLSGVTHRKVYNCF